MVGFPGILGKRRWLEQINLKAKSEVFKARNHKVSLLSGKKVELNGSNLQ